MSKHDDWRHWLEVVETEGTNLSKWESDFIADLREKFDKYSVVYLSDRQAEILERIYAEKTP